MGDWEDRIDQAIEAATRVVPSAEYRGEFGEGRPFSVKVPADLTPAEALKLVEKLAGLPAELARRRGSPIITRFS